MEALQGWDAQEDSPTVVHLTAYLLALDEQYDRQALELRTCLHRAEKAEIFNRMLQVQPAEAHASVAATESRETAMSETLKEAEDRHVHQLCEAYLVTRAKRRTLVAERQDAPILEGIPIHAPEKKKNRCCSAASTSTFRSVRSRAIDSSHSAIAKRRCRSIAKAVEESAKPGNEDV